MYKAEDCGKFFANYYVIGELSKLSLIIGSDNGPGKCFNIGACAICNL